MSRGGSDDEAETNVTDASSENDAECMGCKAVTFTTPLLISSYLIYHHYSLEKVRQLPFATDWTGRNAWKVHVHRINLCVVVPLALCYATYAQMFKFGPFAPGALKQSKTLQDEIKSDTDSFTRGTLKLADWFSSVMAEKKDVWKDTLAKLKHSFAANDPPSGKREP